MIGRTPHERPRKGARSRADISPDILDGLEAGNLATATLCEALALDFGRLLQRALPKVAEETGPVFASPMGIVQRMELGGVILAERLSYEQLQELSVHPSDTIRGWVAYGMATLARQREECGLPWLLEALRPLADDGHFGVREWAWMAARPLVSEHLDLTWQLLTPWISQTSPYLRRFATEVTRPRGVWCAMIPELVRKPQPGLILLEPLRSDGAEYVRLSVANWLNDASKSQPDWVTRLCRRWLKESPTAETRAVVTRATRTLRKKGMLPAEL
jgi:3-methyladenine DNA glycosylase AlkC